MKSFLIITCLALGNIEMLTDKEFSIITDEVVKIKTNGLSIFTLTYIINTGDVTFSNSIISCIENKSEFLVTLVRSN